MTKLKDVLNKSMLTPIKDKIEEEVKKFENVFIYKAYGIVEGEGKAMSIRRQQEYQPMTYENVLDFLRSSLLSISKQAREETLKEVREMAEGMKKDPIATFKNTFTEEIVRRRSEENIAFNHALDSLINKLKK